MIIVAIDMPLGAPDQFAKPFSEATGKTNFEALARLRGASGCPLAIASFNAPEPASALAGNLTGAGFKCIVLDQSALDEELAPFRVRRFSLDSPDTLVLWTAQNEQMDIPYANLRAILKGTSSVSHTDVETIKETKFSASKAIMSSGLAFTTTTEKTVETTTEERENFMKLYIDNAPPILMRESGIDYSSLGALKQPSRMANFMKVGQEIRSRAKGAAYDERLLNRQVQAQVLGPTLNPLSHIHIATALMKRSILKEGIIGSK